MGLNDYDEALEQLEGQPGPSEDPRYKEALGVLKQRDAAGGQQLKTAAAQAADVAPERAADVQRISRQLAIPAPIVERNFDALKKRAALEAIPLEAIQKQTPTFAEWSADPTNHQVSRDDMEQLGALEWLFTAPQRAFTQGVNQVRYGQLAANSIFRPLTQEEQDLKDSYKLGMEAGGELGAGGHWFRGAVTGTLRQAWNTIGNPYAIIGGAGGLVLGGAAGAVVGGPPGALAGAMEAGKVGLQAGGIYGTLKGTFALEAGLAYDEYQSFRDEHGAPIDNDVAKLAAVATGAINAPLEVIGTEFLLKSIPGLNKLTGVFTRDAVKTALRSPTVRAALKNAIVSYGKTLTAETAQELSQEAVTILSGELAKYVGAKEIIPGQLSPGNINLFGQPRVKNADGSTSTVDSVSVGMDGKEVLLSRVTPDGRHVTTDEAVKEYQKTGQHLGMFDTPASADAFASKLHADYAAGVYDRQGFHATGAEAAQRMVDTGLGAVQSFALMVAPGPILSIEVDRQRAKNAAAATDFVKALGEGTANSKTVQRMPAAAQAFIAKATKDGPLENLYAPTETWVAYWQSQGVDPAKMADEVTGETGALAKAQTAGTDLRLPTARYAVTLAPTDHNQFFAEELRLAPDQMNAREAAAFAEEQKKQRASQAGTAEAKPDNIKAQVTEQLVAAGIEPSTANSYAELYGAVGNLAERAGVNPEELFAGYGLKVGRPTLAEGQTTEVKESDVNMAVATGSANIAAATAQAPAQEAIPGLGALESSLDPNALGSLQVADEGAAGPNASGESDASLEALNRLAGMQARGEQFVVYNRAGKGRPLLGPDAVDYTPRAGETFGVQGPTEFHVLEDRGGHVPSSPGNPRVVDNNSRQPQTEVAHAPADSAQPDTGAAAGPDVSNRADQQPGADSIGSAEAGGNGDRVERRRLPPPEPEQFVRQAKADVEARLTPEVRRELERILNELNEFPATKNTWTWLTTRGGNAGGGHADRVKGDSGAKVFGDIKLFAPTNIVTSGKYRGQLGNEAAGSIPKVAGAVSRMLAENDVRNGLGEGALRVAERRAIGDYSNIHTPELPPHWGTVADQAFTDELSLAIDDELNAVNMLDVDTFEREILEPEGEVDTSFNVDEFDQSLFDDQVPDARVDTLATGEKQPRLEGAETVRDQEVATPAFEAPFALTSEVAKPKGKGNQRTLFQSAFHGSPHEFERFSLQAIGTGEGNQAYGWGLYFASQRAIADNYRKALAPGSRLLIRGRLLEKAPGDENWTTHKDEWIAAFARNLLSDTENGTPFSKAKTQMVMDAEFRLGVERKAGRTQEADEIEAAIKELHDLEPGDIVRKMAGRTYTVDIPGDDDFLAWDAPASQQSAKVQAALEQLGIQWAPLAYPTLSEGVDLIDRAIAHDPGGWGTLAVERRELLNEGRHYAEMGNEDAFRSWFAQHHDEVGVKLNDPLGRDIYAQLVTKAAVAGKDTSAARGAFGLMRRDDSVKAASQALASVGLAGIRYLDGQSRVAGEGSNNYVVVDDALVQVREFDQAVRELTEADVQTWVKDLRDRVGPDLQVLDVYLTAAGDLSLETIAIDRGASRAGLGSRVMLELTRFADRHGKRIVLSPADKGYHPTEESAKTTSYARLVKFYSRFGFVRNAGRNIDFTLSKGMYREPTATKAAVASAPFKEWFGDSKVVNEDGTPKMVHHGTARGDRVGNAFQKSRATSGPMAFFTEDRAIAQKYSTAKQDTSLEAPADYAGWFKMRPAGMKREVDLRQAWFYLTQAQKQTVLERLPTVGYANPDTSEGPIIAGSSSIAGEDHIDYLLKREARGNGLVAAMELWLSSGSLFNDEAKFLDVLKGLGLGDLFRMDDPNATQPKVYDVFLSIQNPLDTQAIPPAVMQALEDAADRQRRVPDQFGADLWDKRTRDPQHWIQQLKEDYAKGENSFVWSSIPDWVTSTLKAAGYDGIRDTGGKMGGDAHIVWVPFEPTQIKSAVENRGTYDPNSPNILKQLRRGAIRFGPGRQVSIDLLERADLSTFLHETGHLFLEIMGDLRDSVATIAEANRSDAQRGLLADYDRLLKWFGVDGRGAIDVDQHEQFARGFEAYLMEGRAPSVALEGAFSRFRAWLVAIYKSVKSLNVQLTPEVRSVFDRLLVSDDAIANAEARRGVPAMFTTAASAGMTEAAFGLYKDTIAKASKTAREQLDRKLLADVRREQEATYKAQKSDVRAKVATEVHERREYRALAAMQKGTNADGSPIVDGLETPPMKLSRQILVDRYGEQRLARLPRPFIYAREGGLDPNVVAEAFGFASGDEMLDAVEHAPAMGRVIDSVTEQRMLAEHGSLLLDGTLFDAATAAISNEDRELVIRQELRALAQLRRTVRPFVAANQKEADEKSAAANRERAYERRWFEAEARLRIAIAEGKKQEEIDALTDEVSNLKRKARGGAATINAAIPPAGAIKRIAEDAIASTRIGDIKPDAFWSASRRAAQQAINRAARQDFDGAIAAKQQELISLAMYRVAESAREDIDDRVKFAKSLASGTIRAQLGKAGASYLDQVDAVLDRFDFVKASPKVLERRAALRDFLAGLEATGQEAAAEIPEELLDEAKRTHYTNLTVDELVGVTDGLKQLLHLARLKNRLLKAQDAREFGIVRDEVETSIRFHNAVRPTPLEFRPVDNKFRAISDFFASHHKIAELAHALDGNQDGGALWTHVIKPLNDAANAEQERKRAAGSGYAKILETYYPGRELGTWSELLHIPAIGASLSKEARLSVALNWGNETSRDRLTADPRRRWNRQQVDAILDTLDKRDWDFVQATWNHIDQFWSDIVAKQERVTGIAPEKVEAAAVVTKFGDYKGGYYPLVYDTRLNLKAAQNQMATDASLLTSAAYLRTTTKRGHVQARKQNVKNSIRLEVMSVVGQHMEQVIHDLTHHETLIDVTRVLRDPTVSKAILETRGDIVYQQFAHAFQAIAVGSSPARNVMDRAANFLRSRTQLAMLGLNLWTGLQQPLGLFNGMATVGPTWVAKGLGRWFTDATHMTKTTEWIAGVSPFMRHRTDNATQDIADLRASFNETGGWFDTLLRTVSADHLTQQTILDGYLWHIGMMQRVADVPTWLGGYEKAKASGENEERSIALADQAVIDSQGSGDIKDLSNIQRGSPIAKLFMTFYSYGNVVFNATSRAVSKSGRQPGQILRMLGDLSLLYVAPAVGTIALAHAFGKRSPDDDPSDWLKEIGGELLSTALNTMVMVRELGGLVQDGARGYAGPAGARLVQLIYQAGAQVKQGEVDEALVKSLNNVAGILFRYPAAQAQRTADGIAALSDGRSHNPLVVFTGAPPKGRE